MRMVDRRDSNSRPVKMRFTEFRDRVEVRNHTSFGVLCGGMGGLGRSLLLLKEPIYRRESEGHTGVRLPVIKGLNPGEKFLASAGCSFRIYATGGIIKDGKYSSGTLYVTRTGIVYIETSGFLGTGRIRRHSFLFSDIDARIEDRGVRGAIGGNVFLVIDHTSQKGIKAYRYSLGNTHALRLLKAINVQRGRVSAPADLERALLRLVKPRGEVLLSDVAIESSLRPLVARLHGVTATSVKMNHILNQVHHTVTSLIADGRLDGIITEDGKYVSNVMLTRKTIQYHVTIDFTSLFSQLETKGIVLQTIDCPSCSGKLEYPKGGDTVVCQFCGSTVHAVDIFDKFKGLL